MTETYMVHKHSQPPESLTSRHGWVDVPACAALLHDLRSMVTRELAEAIVAVDDWPVHNLSIPQHKVCI